MDGLSAAASSIAVVMLAVHLADSVQKLCSFWSSIRDAPEDIKPISLDLDLLSYVLTEIAFEAQHFGPDAISVAALEACSVRVRSFTTILEQIEPDFASASRRIRKWTAFKAVLKRGQIANFQEALDRLKATLLLAQQSLQK